MSRSQASRVRTAVLAQHAAAVALIMAQRAAKIAPHPTAAIPQPKLDVASL